ncbi:MAG: PorT family protein [Chitinophagales bacterium]|nr:PorT family protein [Chitinophagales bacterium]
MKKVCLAVVTVLLAQFSFAQHFQLGVKGGVNISNFTGGNFDAVKKKALVGFQGGLYLNFKAGAFGLQPELLVSSQGAKIDTINAGSYDWKVTYINVPVMAQFRLQGGFYFELGPQVGFKIADEISNSTIDEFAKGLDLSAAAGLGIRGKKGYGIGARYTAGISKVGDFSGTSNINPDFKNGVLQVSLSIPLTH